MNILQQALSNLLATDITNIQTKEYHKTNKIKIGKQEHSFNLTNVVGRDNVICVVIDVIQLSLLLKQNSKLKTDYNDLCDISFHKEISYYPGKTIKTINEMAANKEPNTYSWIYYNIETQQMIGSVSYSENKGPTGYNISLYGLFINPKYQRQGYGRQLITDIISHYNGKEPGIINGFNCTIYIWNMPSFKLFCELGFVIKFITKDFDDNVNTYLANNNKKELSEILELNGQTYTENYYFCMFH
jgi:GNAT superfamily N-acetyltransferase